MEAAEDQLDGPDGLLAMCLRKQVLTHTFTTRDECSYSNLDILYGPVQSIDSVSVDGVLLAATDFTVRHDLGITYIELGSATCDTVDVVATHGYGDNAADVPANIRAAAYLFAAELFNHRGLNVSGPAELVQAVPAFDMIYKLYSRVGQTTQRWSR